MATTKEILDKIPIPPLLECGQKLPKLYRLKSYFHVLSVAEKTWTAEESLELINGKLIEIEDCHSGKESEMEPGLKYNGRMYPIQEDNIERKKDGRIIAITAGNKIIIESDGSFSILSKLDEEPLLIKRYGH